MKKNKNILAADIGGTNSRFAHFQIDENGSLILMATKWLATTEAGSFSQLLEQLRQSDPAFPVDEADIAVIAVAGPVKHGTYSAPPYISWALPSEGGHGYFPFISRQEMAFQEFYREKSGQKHITGNLVVSGRGLRYIHWFLLGEELEPQEVAARFVPESATLAWAAKFYGRVCRDFALDVLALGGLYIAGGVAARNPEILTHANFRNEFQGSPTMGHLLANIPVFLIDNQDSGLWGAAFYGRQILQKG